MERKDGYLDLDFLKDKIKVKEYAIRKKGFIYVIDIDGTEYYFKECGYRDSVTELIVSEMLSKIGIPNVKYDLTKFKNKKGVTSRSFKKEGYRYFSGREIIDNYLQALSDEVKKEEGTPQGDILLEEYEMYKNDVDSKKSLNNFELIMHAIEYHVKDRENPEDDCNRILNELVRYHLADLLLLNQDRNRTNWIIEESDDYIGMGLAFDHADSIKEGKWKSIRIQPYDESLCSINAYKELESFMQISDKRYLDDFTKMREILSLETLDECIRIVEGKIKCEIMPNIKEKIREAYKIHLEKVDEIIERRGKKSNNHDDVDIEGR